MACGLHPTCRSTLMANMRKISAVALFTTLAACAFAQTATTDPVGFTKFSIPTGRKAVGVNLLNPVLVSGVVSSNTDTTITLSGVASVGSLLASGSLYYVEVVGGGSSTYVGDRVDVNTDATIAAQSGTVVLSTVGEGNTFGSLSADLLKGYRVVLRKHVTIGQVFGTKGNTPMRGGAIAASADQILFYRGGAFETYFLLRNSSGSTEQWVMVNGGSTNRDNTPIYPGTGVIVNRTGATPVEITFTGDVRTNAVSRPLMAGYNLVANGFPVDETPATRLMTYANGFSGGAIAGAADRVLTLQSSGLFETYFLLRNSSGSVERWMMVGGGDSTNAALFTWDGAAFIYKVNPDMNHVLPVTF